MKIIANVKMQGIIKEISYGEFMATIIVQFGENIVKSLIPNHAVEDMGIKVGDMVTAVIESTPVDIIK